MKPFLVMVVDPSTALERSLPTARLSRNLSYLFLKMPGSLANLAKVKTAVLSFASLKLDDLRQASTSWKDKTLFLSLSQEAKAF